MLMNERYDGNDYAISADFARSACILALPSLFPKAATTAGYASAGSRRIVYGMDLSY